MLPKTLAFLAFALSFAVANKHPPAPKCHQLCCSEYLEHNSPAFNDLLGPESVVPAGPFGTECTLEKCTAVDVGKQSSCCLYFAQILGYGNGCNRAA